MQHLSEAALAKRHEAAANVHPLRPLDGIQGATMNDLMVAIGNADPIRWRSGSHVRTLIQRYRESERTVPWTVEEMDAARAADEAAGDFGRAVT